ncbi:hypothetical protein FHX81_5509 [Saccharothrix saharensis]|uniref:Uncharacterized protein n=1 Tax=Saccharothrix saharensis TaxID=571190 RepID=A0A543JJZ2_9PSEU|nr:hypothetical protein [Saccharothrix saharensis]TQM83094.1 hypothetical protein FHX81_5509 [Saccharothrix saharensis]
MTAGIAEVTSAEPPACAEALTDLPADAVEDGASVGFVKPLSRVRVLTWWRARAAPVAAGWWAPCRCGSPTRPTARTAPRWPS